MTRTVATLGGSIAGGLLLSRHEACCTESHGLQLKMNLGVSNGYGTMNKFAPHGYGPNEASKDFESIVSFDRPDVLDALFNRETGVDSARKKLLLLVSGRQPTFELQPREKVNLQALVVAAQKRIEDKVNEWYSTERPSLRGGQELSQNLGTAEWAQKLAALTKDKDHWRANFSNQMTYQGAGMYLDGVAANPFFDVHDSRDALVRSKEVRGTGLQRNDKSEAALKAGIIKKYTKYWERILVNKQTQDFAMIAYPSKQMLEDQKARTEVETGRVGIDYHFNDDLGFAGCNYLESILQRHTKEELLSSSDENCWLHQKQIVEAAKTTGSNLNPMQIVDDVRKKNHTFLKRMQEKRDDKDTPWMEEYLENLCGQTPRHSVRLQLNISSFLTGTNMYVSNDRGGFEKDDTGAYKASPYWTKSQRKLMWKLWADNLVQFTDKQRFREITFIIAGDMKLLAPLMENVAKHYEDVTRTSRNIEFFLDPSGGNGAGFDGQGAAEETPAQAAIRFAESVLQGSGIPICGLTGGIKPSDPDAAKVTIRSAFKDIENIMKQPGYSFDSQTGLRTQALVVKNLNDSEKPTKLQLTQNRAAGVLHWDHVRTFWELIQEVQSSAE